MSEQLKDLLSGAVDSRTVQEQFISAAFSGELNAKSLAFLSDQQAKMISLSQLRSKMRLLRRSWKFQGFWHRLRLVFKWATDRLTWR